MATSTKIITINVPVIGETTLGDLIYDCENIAVTQFIPSFVASASLNVGVNANDVKETVGALAELVGDKKLNDFVKKAKKLVPEGDMGLKVAIVPQVNAQPCPNDDTKPAVITCAIFLLVQASVKGKYGFVRGEAGVELLFRLARVIEVCDCATGGHKEEIAAVAQPPEESQEEPAAQPSEEMGSGGSGSQTADLPVGPTLVAVKPFDPCRKQRPLA